MVFLLELDVIILLRKRVWRCIMAASKKDKIVKRSFNPKNKQVIQNSNPNQYYQENPAWSFASIDQEMWPFTEEHIGPLFWPRVFPRLKALESQKWTEILVKNNKQNHSINVQYLNKVAQDRLTSRYIEADSLISLRVTATHRLYGYMTGRVFNILWYDDNHGDKDTCVCRSKVKHT